MWRTVCRFSTDPAGCCWPTAPPPAPIWNSSGSPPTWPWGDEDGDDEVSLFLRRTVVAVLLDDAASGPSDGIGITAPVSSICQMVNKREIAKVSHNCCSPLIQQNDDRKWLCQELLSTICFISQHFSLCLTALGWPGSLKTLNLPLSLSETYAVGWWTRKGQPTACRSINLTPPRWKTNNSASIFLSRSMIACAVVVTSCDELVVIEAMVVI